jgi:hypothetical protein
VFEIVNIDFKLDHNQFVQITDEIVSDESSRTGTSFDWSESEAHLSKSNKSVYKLTFKDLDSGESIELVANKSLNDIEFVPIELRNYNNSFYKSSSINNTDEIASLVLLVLKRSAMKAKGSFGCILNGQSTLVNQGRDMSDHIKGLALIDDKGKVYNLKYLQAIDDDEDDNNTVGYVPRYLINDWLDENPQFQAKIQTISNQLDKFEMMAQFAIYQKRKNMLTSDQFRDILLQVGTFVDMLGGFKNESVKNIYQFFV